MTVLLQAAKFLSASFPLTLSLSLHAEITGSARSDVLEYYACFFTHLFTSQQRSRQKNRPTFKFSQKRQAVPLHAAHFLNAHTKEHYIFISGLHNSFKNPWDFLIPFTHASFSHPLSDIFNLKQVKWINQSGWLVYSFIGCEAADVKLATAGWIFIMMMS